MYRIIRCFYLETNDTPICNRYAHIPLSLYSFLPSSRMPTLHTRGSTNLGATTVYLCSSLITKSRLAGAPRDTWTCEPLGNIDYFTA